jgi:hypothetical protein
MYIVWLFFVFATTSSGANISQWIAGWSQWDASWYERIFHEGYRSYPRMLVFPPLFSWLIGPLGSLIGSFTTGALVINLAAFFAAGVLLTRIAAREFKVNATAFFAFYLSAPAAYFAFAPYSDALFLCAFALALHLALRDPKSFSLKERIGAWGLMFAIPWLRLTGYALCAWVLGRRWFAAGTLVALAAWLAFNHAIAGDPLHFLKAQELFTMPQGNFLDGLIYTVRNIVPGRDASGAIEWTSWLQFIALPLLYLTLILATAVWFAMKRRWILGLTLVAITLFSHNQSFWRSAVRYDLPVLSFVAIPLLSLAEDKRREVRLPLQALFAVLVVASLVAQVYFARLFRTGAWAF